MLGTMADTLAAGPSLHLPLARLSRRPSVATSVRFAPSTSHRTPFRAYRVFSLAVAKSVRLMSPTRSSARTLKAPDAGNSGISGKSAGSSPSTLNRAPGADDLRLLIRAAQGHGVGVEFPKDGVEPVGRHQAFAGLLDVHLVELDADADLQVGCQEGHLPRLGLQLDATEGRFGTSWQNHAGCHLNPPGKCAPITGCFHVRSPRLWRSFPFSQRVNAIISRLS